MQNQPILGATAQGISPFASTYNKDSSLELVYKYYLMIILPNSTTNPIYSPDSNSLIEIPLRTAFENPSWKLSQTLASSSSVSFARFLPVTPLLPLSFLSFSTGLPMIILPKKSRFGALRRANVLAALLPLTLVLMDDAPSTAADSASLAPPSRFFRSSA